jgi:hypothetical protein
MQPRRRFAAALALAVALVAGTLLAGCDTAPENDLSVDEGQPMKLGDLLYNVQISRFLNPSDPEDKAYLAGEASPPNNKLYLGVFMLVDNEADTAQDLPADFKVIDTEGTEFKPVPSHSLFALKLGGKVPANGALPEADSTAASGPIEGAMVLFLIDQSATEDRPLTLEVPSTSGQIGEVELDI